MRKLVTLISAAGLVAALTAPAVAKEPTCFEVVGEVHGHHVVGDYVTGAGHVDLDWPPAGQVNASGGAVLPGGPGPGFHFPSGFAPGASFCNPQSQSPGFHLP